MPSRGQHIKSLMFSADDVLQGLLSVQKEWSTMEMLNEVAWLGEKDQLHPLHGSVPAALRMKTARQQLSSGSETIWPQTCIWFPTWLNSFTKFAPHVCYVSGTVPGARGAAVNKTARIPCPQGTVVSSALSIVFTTHDYSALKCDTGPNLYRLPVKYIHQNSKT